MKNNETHKQRRGVLVSVVLSLLLGATPMATALAQDATTTNSTSTSTSTPDVSMTATMPTGGAVNTDVFGTALPMTGGTFATSTATTTGSGEFHFLSDGTVLVRGLQVTSTTQGENASSSNVSSSSTPTVSATMQSGPMMVDWTINTDNTTQWLDQNNNSIPASAVAVGDVLSLRGQFMNNGMNTSMSSTTVNGLSTPLFSIEATTIKDWSNGAGTTTSQFQANTEQMQAGQVSAVDSFRTVFSMKMHNGESMTVHVLPSTHFASPNSFSDISAGKQVSVTGSLNGNDMTASSVMW